MFRRNHVKIGLFILILMRTCGLFGQEATLRVLIAGDEGGWSPHWDAEEIYRSGDTLTGLTAGQSIGIDLVQIPDKWSPFREVIQLGAGENVIELAYLPAPEMDFALGGGELFYQDKRNRHEVRGGNKAGSVIVGNYLDSGVWRPSTWRAGRGIEAVRQLLGTEGMNPWEFQTLQGVSEDGRVLVGRAVDSLQRTVPVVWQLAGDDEYRPSVLPVPELGGGSLSGRAIAVNEAGTVIVGTRLNQGAVWQRSTSTGQWVLHAETGLGRWQNDAASAGYGVWLYDVSGEGQVSVGWIELLGSGSGFDELAVVFENGELHELPTPDGFAYSLAYGISADGNRVVGVLGDDVRDHLALWQRSHRGSPWTLQNYPVPHPFVEINIPNFANRDGDIAFAPLVSAEGSLHGGHVWTPESGFVSANEWFADQLGVTVTAGYEFRPRFLNPQNGVAYGEVLGGGRVGFRLQVPGGLQWADLRVEADGGIPAGHPAEWRVAGGKWYAIGSTGKVAAGDRVLEIRGAPGYRTVPNQLIRLEAGQTHQIYVALAEHEVTRGAVLASIDGGLPNRAATYYRAIPDGLGGIWATAAIQSTAGLGGALSGALYRLDAHTGQPLQGFSLQLGDPTIWLMDVFPDGAALIASRNGEDEYLRKILPDGSEDPGFHPFRVNRTRMAKVLANGDIVVAVAETVLGGPILDAMVYRLRPDGRVDPRWRVVRLGALTEGPWETNVWSRFVEDTQGRILIAGAFASVNGVATDFVARLLPDGRLDQSFQTALTPFANRAIRSLGIQSDGKILVAGVFALPDNPNTIGPLIVRLHENGSLDTSFQAPAYNDVQGRMLIYDMMVLPDDRLLVSGSMGALRLFADGSIDPAFAQVAARVNSEIYPADWVDYLYWIAPVEGGYLLAGSVDDGGIIQGVRQFGLFKVDAQGGLIPAFSAPQPFTLTFPNRAAPTPSGDLLAWGLAGQQFQRAFSPRIGLEDTHNVVRLQQSGAAITLTPFHSADFAALNADFRDGLQLPSGRMLALVQSNEGFFQLFDVRSGGLTPLTYVEQVFGNFREMRPIGESAVALMFTGSTSGDNVQNNQIREFRVLSYSSSGELVGDVSRWQNLQISTHPDFGYEEYAFASVDDVNLWHVDAFMRMWITSPDAQGNPVLRRYLSNGAEDSSFAPVTFSSRTEVPPNSVFIQALQRQAQRISSAARIHSVVVLADGSALVGGEFDQASVAGQPITGSPLLQITPSGHGRSILSLPVQLSGNQSVAVHEILPTGAYLYVVGTFSHCNDVSYGGLVRLFASDLAIDHRFRPGVEFMRYDYSHATLGGAALLPDGNLLLMGQFGKPGDLFPTPFHVLDTSPLGPWSLQANASNTEAGVVQGSGQYTDGAIFSLTAIPSPGYQFVGWQELDLSSDNPLRRRMDEDLSLTAVFEPIPLSVASIPSNFAYVPGPDATLSVDASGYNLTFEWLVGDNPDQARVIPSTNGQLAMADLNLIGGQSLVIRLRVSDGFGNSMVSAPTLVSAESPLKGHSGWLQTDTLVGDVAVHGDELAFSSTYGWFFHAAFPWIYLPDLGWAHAQSAAGAGDGQILWLEDYGWVWVPIDSTGEFYIITESRWSAFY